MCRCRVYGRYTAGRSETLLRTAMVFSILFFLNGNTYSSSLFVVFIEVHMVSVYMVAVPCHLYPSHFNAIGRGPEALGTAKYG